MCMCMYMYMYMYVYVYVQLSRENADSEISTRRLWMRKSAWKCIYQARRPYSPLRIH